MYVCIPNPQLSHILPMFASISHDTHGWGMVQNLQSLPRTHKYPLIFPFYVHIHTCMHTYKNGYSPQMLFHLPECACLLAGPGHGQLQRDGFLTLLFKVYAIQRWVKATKKWQFCHNMLISHIRPTCLNSNVEPKHDSFQKDNKDIL